VGVGSIQRFSILKYSKVYSSYQASQHNFIQPITRKTMKDRPKTLISNRHFYGTAQQNHVYSWVSCIRFRSAVLNVFFDAKEAEVLVTLACLQQRRARFSNDRAKFETCKKEIKQRTVESALSPRTLECSNTQVEVLKPRFKEMEV